MAPEPKLVVDGDIIRREKLPSDSIIQLASVRKIASCKNEEWAKKLAAAYNKAHGNQPAVEGDEQVSANFFADMVANGVPEVEAAVMTLRYLSGYFSDHIQGKNVKSAADVLFTAYQRMQSVKTELRSKHEAQ